MTDRKCELVVKVVNIDNDKLSFYFIKWTYIQNNTSKCKCSSVVVQLQNTITQGFITFHVRSQCRYAHVADITSRANKLLGLLKRNLSTCDRRVKEATYLGLVRPLLEYASQDWDPYTDNLSNEIEKTQRRTARFVTSDYQNYELGSVTTLLKDLGCKSLKNRREVDRLCPLKKGLDNNAILSLDELSKPARKTTHMHNRYYTTIYVRTNIFKFSFVPRIIRDWNNKPHNVVEIADDAKFRKLFLFTIL